MQGMQTIPIALCTDGFQFQLVWPSCLSLLNRGQMHIPWLGAQGAFLPIALSPDTILVLDIDRRIGIWRI